MIRAVIMDFDGVILDSVGIKTNAFARLFEDRGPAAVQQVVDYHLAHGGISRFRKFAYIFEKVLGQPLSETESVQLGDRFSELVFDEVVKAAWIPGAQEFLLGHHQRYSLFVASGTPQEELEQIVQLRGLRQYFAGVLGSPASKSEIVTTVVTKHHLERSETVFVGDAITDYEAAVESDVHFIGIAPASSSSFPPSAKVLPDLRSLPETISQIGI